MKEHKNSHGEETPAPAADTALGADQPAPAPEPAKASDADQLKNQLLRLQADFDNFRKRTQRDRLELSTRAVEDIILELLPIIDHFEIGLAAAIEHKTEPSVQDGFRMVYDQLLISLKKFGLTPLDAQSPMFDPHQHEAVSHVPSDEYVADEIVAQTRRGYKLGERLLRPVQVVVSSGPGPLRDDGERVGGTGPEAKAT